MKSLYTKFALTTITIMLASGLISFIISNTYYQQKLKPYNDEKNTKIALQIVDYINSHENINLDQYLQSISSIGYQLYLADETGKGVFYGEAFRDTHLPSSTKKKELNGDIYHGIALFPQETFVTGFFANELKKTIGVPLQNEGRHYALFIRPDIKLLFNEMHVLFGWLLGLTIILSIVLVAISTKFLVKPISKLTSATKDLSQGHFSIKLDIDRDDELGELANSFNYMAKKLERLDDMKNEFISNISHDIQSPLSNIKGYTALLEKNSITAEEKKNYISVIQNEITRLSNLTKQLLLLASLHRNEGVIKKKEFNVSKQLKEIILNYQWTLSEKGMMISYSLPDTYVIGDSSLLYTVWDNLITNAIKYNKKNGSIHISVKEKVHTIEISFQDTGIGLSDDEIDRIFDRFYRVDSARTRKVDGTGLGLSIVSSIMKLHDGHIKVNSTKGEGTTFTVSLPML
ncbi:HAMP domain-containing histidine kinase [Bacillus aquiflavi]|uniref:sensor histidine kinase n=1 Tax=Bacillus aquiflavi TaxID=2672567 RepID=UPI001CA92252|nr:HAMP domain-containing sensor histidine kinase [Bacillus aquiflavi]UAC49624.1 HAMP domain-containing histidine kinase [Bacillus aquiflavi]